MSNCKNLKKNQKLVCANCGLEFLVINECKNKDQDGCCSKEAASDSHLTCCGKELSLKQ